MLFPHENDPAYQALCGLEDLIADFVAVGATAPFKQRLQRAIARLSEALVELADDPQRGAREALLFRALLDCRKAANAIRLLHKGRVFDRKTRAVAFELLSDIAQRLIDRIHTLRGSLRPAPLPLATFNDATLEPVADGTAPPRPPGEDGVTQTTKRDSRS
jgi:hypothetical protein